MKYQPSRVCRDKGIRTNEFEEGKKQQHVLLNFIL